MKKFYFLLIVIQFSINLFGCVYHDVSFEINNNGIIISENKWNLSLQVETPSVIRVRYGDLEKAVRPMYHLVEKQTGTVKFKTLSDFRYIGLETSDIIILYNKETGLLTFKDAKDGKILLEECLRKLKGVNKFGEKSFEMTQGFKVDSTEFISGTGFQQDDLVDFNGRYAYLCQWNTTCFVPFIQSNNGWSILWNNHSLTELNPDPECLPIKPTSTQEAYYVFTAEETGRYFFSLHRDADKRFGKLELSVGEKVLFNKRPAWDPMVLCNSVELEKGKSYTIRAIGDFKVYYKKPSARNHMILRSEMGEVVDYHFIAGNTADERIAGYRMLTGRAPMFAKWSYGFFQSRQCYRKAADLLDIVSTYRNKHIPMDCIVQDWWYWGRHGWNAMSFDDKIFPNMEEVIEKLHSYNSKLIISIWPNFGNSKDGCIPLLNEFKSKGWILERNSVAALEAPIKKTSNVNAGFIDMMNPDAGKTSWNIMNENLNKIGIDGWWVDATEPNVDGFQGAYRYCNTAAGIGAYWLNLYPTMRSKYVYEGQRESGDNKRAFLLGRTAYAGIQRFGTTVWSGDIWSDWETFNKQIATGITNSYSGIPYWGSDTGGFEGFDIKDSSMWELYTRWFQFSAFCPTFRSHGGSIREPWNFPKRYEDIQLKYLNLRYRLLPYIYSEAANVTFYDGTLMRGLMFDFPKDEVACRSKDSYMFGPSFLVCPITEPFESDDKMGRTVPVEVLYDENGQPGGLSSVYYNGIEDRKLVQRGKDAVLDFTWDTKGMNQLESKVDTIKGLDMNRFSANWEGYIKIFEPGEYQFVVVCEDGVRFWLDNDKVIDVWSRSGKKSYISKIRINEPCMLPIKLEHFQDRSKGTLKLLYKKLSGGNEEDTWKVYLPDGSDWYDFWTGEKHSGGKYVEKEVSLDILPLYVKSGSIVPFGPKQEWADQKPLDEVEIRIYPGKDASYVLYEDEGDNYNYEKGKYSLIKFEWNDKKRILKVNKRTGDFDGMVKNKHFKIVKIGKGDDERQNVIKEVTYIGDMVQIEL